MKRDILFGAVALLVASLIVAVASAEDEIKSAAKKLAEKANYSWTTTVDAGGGGNRFNFGPIEGKTDNGLSWTSVTFGQNTVEAIVKGDKGAAKTQDGWQSKAELTADNGDQQNRGRRFIGRMLDGFKTPAAQAEDIASKAKELKLTDGAYAGDLTEEGSTELLLFGRRPGGNNPPPTKVKGSAKFWIKDGVLSKFEVHLEGTVTYNGNEVDTDRTTTTEIKDIGSTKIEVPDEAKEKLK